MQQYEIIEKTKKGGRYDAPFFTAKPKTVRAREKQLTCPECNAPEAVKLTIKEYQYGGEVRISRCRNCHKDIHLQLLQQTGLKHSPIIITKP